VSNSPSSPRGQGTASSFYRPRGGGLQSCRATLSATCGSMAHSVTESTVVLTNLASGGRRGESCSRPGAASRVATLELLFGRCPYAGSRVGLTEDRRPHSGGRGDVPSTWVPTVLGMTLQCLGWRYSGRNGRTGLEVTGRRAPLASRHGVVPDRRGVGDRTPFEGAAVLFRGGDMEELREWAAQCHGMTPGFPHSARTAPGMTTQCGLVKQRRG
jgi:hypothetical protein